MPIQVFLAATLRRFIPDYNPEKGVIMEVSSGSTVLEVTQRLGIPPEEVKIVMVNGIHSSMDKTLEGNERVAFFPAVGGG